MRNWVDIPISHQLFKHEITEGNVTVQVCRKGLPIGAVFVRSWYDKQRDVVHLIYAHPHLDEVPEGGIIPQLYPEFEHIAVYAEGRLCYAASGEMVF